MNALEYLEMLLWGLILLALAAAYLAGLIIREILNQRAYAKMVETLPPAALQQEFDDDRVEAAQAGEHEPQQEMASHWRAIFRGKAGVLSGRVASADRFSSDKIVIGEATLPLLQLHNGNLGDRPALTGERTEQAV